MFEDLNEKWRQDIENKKVVLLGEISVSDEEYNHLRNVFRKYIIRNDNYPVAPNLSISMFLVQAAIREYTGGKYWDTVGKMINQPISRKVRNKTNEIFYKTISSYDLFMLPEKENGIKLYLEMIKAHAFVTNNYMNGFFDFVNAYFETVLFRQLSQKNVSEDLSALSTFMRETLEDGDDILITRKNDKVPKIYRLLKSTRSVIAYIDSERLTKLLYPMLKCVDDYFYDSVLPNDMGNRFNKSFCSWVQFQEYEVAGEKRTHIRRVSSRKPYIFIDEYGRAMLNIPQQKFRQEECAGFARAEVIFGDEQEDEKGTLFDGGEIVECDLDVYKQWGLYISDELSVPVPHLFESITIRIYGASEEPIKEFYISSSNYRILDIHNKETRALKNGENKLLIASDLHPVVNENAEIISREPAGDWVIYSIKCSVDSEIKIGDKKLRFTNKDFTDAEYENEEDNELNTEYYTVTDAVGNIIKCTHTHPIITIYTDRIYENGIVIYVNHDKLPLKWIKIEFEDAINVMNDLSFKDKVSIVVNLEKIFCSESGFYEVSADVPSKNVPYSICRYICVPNNFTVKRNRRVYQGNCDFLATIRQNTENAIDFEPLFNCEISDRHYAYNVISRQYKTTAADTENQVQFKFSYVGREFVMSIPAPKFKFGGSAESMAYKFDPNWYKDIPDNMYVCIPGAFYMRIMFEWDNKQHIADGEFISDYTFRFDMREINGVIKSVNNRCSMHLSVFTSDKIPAKIFDCYPKAVENRAGNNI